MKAKRFRKIAVSLSCMVLIAVLTACATTSAQTEEKESTDLQRNRVEASGADEQPVRDSGNTEQNRLSVDCDCNGSPTEPDMHDIGILASFDPVALDQACVDLVYAAEDGQSLINRIESRNGLHTLEQAEKIGLGSRQYQLVNIDE